MVGSSALEGVEERGHKVVVVAGWLVAGLGLLVLIGWFAGVDTLKSVLPGVVTMKANTAAGLLLLGLALRLRVSRRGRLLGAIAAAIVGVAALVTVSQDILGVQLHLDRFLIGEDLLPVDTGMPGRMAPFTALGFVLLSASVLATRSPWLSQSFALLALGVGALALVGHLYGLDRLHQLPALTDMALHTCVGMMVAASGALFLRPATGPPAAMLDDTQAGQQLRRLLPAVVALPLIIGALTLAGERADWWGAEFQVSISTLSTVAVLIVAALLFYRELRHSEVERLSALASLAVSEDRFRSTFANATIGIAHVGADGRWIRVNGRLCGILGYDEAELMQMTYMEVSLLEDLEVDVQQWELLRRGEIADYGTERRFCTKEGEVVHAEVRLVREQDEAGALLYFILLLEDVTGRKHSEGTLRVYGRALAATQNGVLITDAGQEDHPIVYANAAFLEITGYEESEVIGKNCRFLNERARDQAALAEVRRAVRSGTECQVLLRNHRKDGEAFWNQLSIAPVTDSDGAITHFVGIQIDVTERVDAMAERDELLRSAEAANQSKDRLLSVVSHELRSPLNAILAWSSILREEHSSETVGRAVNAIDASVHSQTHLVDSLLDASRMGAGSLEVSPTRTELRSIVQTAVDQLLPQSKERKVTLLFHADPREIHAVLDPQRMDQIVRNLVENALKFTPEGGRVDVTVAGHDEHCSIEVRDTGQGLSADAIDHVFEEFWQESRKDSSGGNGLGLGLPIVKYLVERHGGSVRVESEGAGRGATFHVWLPRTPADEAPARPEPIEDPTSLAGLDVVVVDDDPASVEGLLGALKGAGAIPRGASSVAEALRLFEQNAPEIVVSDIGLPDRDGFDFIRTLRGMDAPANPVLAIAVTGIADSDGRRRILRAGFDSYVGKPVAPAVVVERLRGLWKVAKGKQAPRRKLLMVGGDRVTSAPMLRSLRSQGHDLREADDEENALRVLSDFAPDIVLVIPPLGDLPPAALVERLRARGLNAAFVGVLDPEGQVEQKAFDFVLTTPVEEHSLERLLRFAVESS